jgi:hypothetical protein
LRRRPRGIPPCSPQEGKRRREEGVEGKPSTSGHSPPHPCPSGPLGFSSYCAASQWRQEVSPRRRLGALRRRQGVATWRHVCVAEPEAPLPLHPLLHTPTLCRAAPRRCSPPWSRRTTPHQWGEHCHLHDLAARGLHADAMDLEHRPSDPSTAPSRSPGIRASGLAVTKLRPPTLDLEHAHKVLDGMGQLSHCLPHRPRRVRRIA